MWTLKRRPNWWTISLKLQLWPLVLMLKCLSAQVKPYLCLCQHFSHQRFQISSFLRVLDKILSCHFVLHLIWWSAVMEMGKIGHLSCYPTFALAHWLLWPAIAPTYGSKIIGTTKRKQSLKATDECEIGTQIIILTTLLTFHRLPSAPYMADWKNI